MNPMKVWMQGASAGEKKQLAELADTTLGTLNQIAGGYRTNGEARVEPSLAARIELGTKMLARKGLKSVSRTQLSPVCASCEFAKRCGK